ncbi:MAG TPA: SCO family protein [Polyangiaceae bacterium]|nr:SCO family protein [Polyangiaceae bacterium]
MTRLFWMLCLALAASLATPGASSAEPARAALRVRPEVGGTAPPPAMLGIGVDERVGARLPLEARFVASDGRSVRLGELVGNGKPALLVLAYNRCSMLCSLVLRGVGDLVRRSETPLGSAYSLVTISIDPRDTVHEAARTQATVLAHAGYADRRELWPFLVGEKAAIDAVAEAVGFRYRWDERTEQYAHPAVIFAISPKGEVVRYLHGIRFEPAEVRAAFEGKPASEGGKLVERVLACFRFEGVAARYRGLIERAFQIGAGGIFLALCLGIALLSRKGARAGRE